VKQESDLRKHRLSLFSPLLAVERFADAAGFPVQIALIQRLRCGLTSKAIDAVAQWKFSPAVGPDGKPLVVVVQVEVTFRLY
jgi:hypothetical protein